VVSFSTWVAYMRYISDGGFCIVVTLVFLGVKIILFVFAILSLFLSFKKKEKNEKEKKRGE